jgi:hypothetical protein
VNLGGAGAHGFIGGTVPQVVASANATAQGANIGSTTLYAVPAGSGGMYRASVYLVITQAATTSSTMPAGQVAWTDSDTSGAEGPISITNTSTANIVGLPSSSATGLGMLVIYAKAGTNITYSTTGYVSSGVTPMQYAIHVRLEYLGV